MTMHDLCVYLAQLPARTLASFTSTNDLWLWPESRNQGASWAMKAVFSMPKRCQEVVKKRIIKKPIQDNLCTNKCTARCASNWSLDIFPSHLTHSAILISFAAGLRLQLEVLERKDVKVEAPRTTPFTLLSCVESTGEDEFVLAGNIQ